MTDRNRDLDAAWTIALVLTDLDADAPADDVATWTPRCCATSATAPVPGRDATGRRGRSSRQARHGWR